MIYELVHFISKFVVIYLDGIFIHHDLIAYHQLHDHITLSIHYHIHAIDKPSHYDIILHRGCIDHIHNTFVCTMNAFAPMNALHLIPYHLAKLHVLCHEQSCLTDSFLHDGHLVCANHCISKCRLCLLFLHVYHSGDTLEYLDCAMSSTSSNYKSVHDNRFHGDEVFDPRSDLSQGRGDDAEHPTIIPMYTRAYAIGPKVNSLLSESSLSACKTWMLLQARTLCILRYTRGDHGEPKDQGQVCAGAKEGEGRRDSCYRPRTSGPSPDIRPDPRKSGAHHRTHPKLNPVSPDIRPEARTSGSS